MPLFALAFFLGDLLLQTFSHLPSKGIIVSLLIASCIIWMILSKHTRWCYLPIAFVLGFAFSAWYAQSLLAWSLPKELEGRPILITGYIHSLPTTDLFGTRFVFALENKTLVRLSWRKVNQPLRVGEKRRLLVKLKRIHGLQSPGAFDFEAWALQGGIRATGYVLPSRDNVLLSHDVYRYPINQLRQALQDKIKEQLPDSSTSPWLMALTLGERNGIAPQDWQVLRNTGTNHLMAIAGLHIGMMAGLAQMFVSRLWRLFPSLLLRFPAKQAGACAALFIAVLYSALAGFSLPTQRACIMLTIFILALLSRRKIHAWHSWSLALLLVLVLNPLSVLTESFWLSFATIALIIYGMGGRLAPRGLWWKWGRVQWVVGIGLTPITLALFQQSSLVSFLANSIAIPWLGFFILPFCFLSALFVFIVPSISAFLLWIANKSLSLLWLILTWFSDWSFSSWHHALPNLMVTIIAVIGFILLLLPAGFSIRALGVIYLLPLFFYQTPRPERGDFWMTLLDVGQGLSVIVQTKQHTLLYDAGPRLSANMDSGESIVLPYLRTMNIKKIDILVISHGDNDHIGGANAIIKNKPVHAIFTSTPEKLSSQIARYCLAGMHWQWDGVDFSFLYPPRKDLDKGNDSSCVLRIDNGEHAILLSGDIEKYAENVLTDGRLSLLSASILVAPHHGSKTSGQASFIQAVHPQFVLYSTGYRNRYHFPHPTVVSAYNEIGAKQLNTSDTGTLLFKLEKNQPKRQPELYREKHKRYWMDGVAG
jgi:competence protein ComEC